MDVSEKYLIVIVGPTAIGKTALAIEIARYFKCEIISCDSRQFYQEMSVGTAVPSEAELTSVKHHFIHNKSVFEHYTVGDFEKDAIAKLDVLFESDNFVVMVGGSGLYANAVVNGLDEFPIVNPEVRYRLAVDYEKQGIGYLQEELRKRDPEYYKIVATENPQRLVRALEVCIESAQPYSSFLGKMQKKRGFTPIYIGLEAERKVIYERIDARVDLMMSAGLLDEARNLYQYKNLNALKTVGYRELFAYFDGDFSLEFAVAEIKKNTRRFAKRQLAWFKRIENVTWFDFQSGAKEINEFIFQSIFRQT